MKRIVGSIVLNQCSGKEWLFSEAILDLVRIYTYLSGDNDYDNVSEHLDVMVEERRNFHDAKNLRSNLLEVHCNMQAQVKYKLTNALAPLLQIPVPKTYHYWFRYFLGTMVCHGA